MAETLRVQAADRGRVPTSVALDRLLDDAPTEAISLGWIIDHLHERSFGIVLLLVAVVGLIPGLSAPLAVLMAIPAFQMMLARPGPVLPQFVTRRAIAKSQLARVVRHVAPVLRRLERIVRPRWATPFEATKRVVGLVVLLLAATILAPIPFTHIPPLLVVILIAFAYLEEDGVLLSIALAAALVSLGLTVATIWGTIAEAISLF